MHETSSAPRPQYLIAYGSLLSRESRVEYSNIHGHPIPILLRGWKRAWCVRHQGEMATHAGAVREEGAELSGLLVPTVITDALRDREKYYRFTQVDRSAVSSLTGDDSIPIDGEFWVCEPKSIDNANEDFPLLQSYVDTCMVGCIESDRAGWGRRFVSETTGWNFHWVNDRGNQPLYPRSAALSVRDCDRVDRLLQEGGVLAARLTLEDAPKTEQRVTKREATHVFVYDPASSPTSESADIRARLRNYVLCLRGKEVDSGDARGEFSLVPEPGFVVYGTLHEIGTDEAEFPGLSEYVNVEVEDFCPSFCAYCNSVLDGYRRASPPDDRDSPPHGCACTRNPRLVNALAKRVVSGDDETSEVNLIPRPGDIDRVVRFAKEAGLPNGYREALGSFSSECPLGPSAKRLMVVPTLSRGTGHPLPVVQLSRELKDKVGDTAVVSFSGASCLAIPQYVGPGDKPLGRHSVGVDENLRIRLGLPTREPRKELYACCITVTPAGNCRPPRQLMNPRNLILGIKSVHHIHSEKDVAVIDQTLMDLLGGESGDFIKVTAYTFGENGEPSPSTINVRAMSAPEKQWAHWDPDRPYPMTGCIHLDADYRKQLNLDSGSRAQFKEAIDGYPVLVSISVLDLIKKRVLVYTFSLLGLVLGLSVLVRELLGEERLVISLIVGTLIAAVILVTVIRTEISTKIR